MTFSEPQIPTIGEIFKEYAPFVWRSVRYLGVAESDVEDVSQDVFIVVHRRLDSFEGRSKLRTWLYGICLRVVAGHRRKAHRRYEDVVAEPPAQERAVETPEEALSRNDTRRLLNQALNLLDQEKREVFVLFELEHLDMAEIAQIVGCPRKTAYSRLYAARRVVVAHLEKAQGTRRSPASESKSGGLHGGR